MAIYLNLAGFKDLTTIPAAWVDEVETVEAGWVAKQLDYWSRWIDSRLRKRYATPFAAFDDDPPTPVAVQGWLVRIVTIRIMVKRGTDPNDVQMELLRADNESAVAEVTEAANGEVGLFDLPERTSADGSLITRPGPRSYSEASPYVGATRSRDTGRVEDSSGYGSGD